MNSNETKHASLFVIDSYVSSNLSSTVIFPWSQFHEQYITRRVDFCAYGCEDDLDCVGVGTQKVVNFEGDLASKHNQY